MTEIAIIGMACRFPSAPTIAAYWKLLADGVEAVADPPLERAELAQHGRGGYLAAIDQFEPAFFRISPREAAKLDPQQRLLLEVAWEALEDAGQPVAALAGSTTGVFVGVMNADFSRTASRDLANIDAQLGPGSSLGIAPNRVSYALDLRGPSLAIDTLCSSSLVAVHLACQSLASDESAPIAIAGGVNVILDRTMNVFYERAGLASKEGRCRAFDASAAGIVRGEGCGIVVLKKLSRALADGDRIHAVIRGSAVNQDGRSNGLTAPNRWAQEEVLRAAYRRASIAPSEVAYVEAHGTGTLIGDPIETAALGAVLGDERSATLAIGSVKSNLGHLESAAGVASLIKTVLALQHRTLPPSLHFERANPYARFEERKLRVPTHAEPWSGELVAGVSSFGMGGTNAHVVVAAHEPAPRSARSTNLALIPISARSAEALDAIDRRLTEQLETRDAAELAHAYSLRRDHHDHRRAIVAFGSERLATVSGKHAPGRLPRLVFVLPRGTDRSPLATWREVGVTPDETVHVDEPTARPTVCTGEDGTVYVELAPFRFAKRELFLQAVASLYCLGFAIEWRALAVEGTRFASIGTYPWQRETCRPTFSLGSSTPPAAHATVEVIAPHWERATAEMTVAATFALEGTWAVIGDGGALTARLAEGVTTPDAARNVVVFCGAELAPAVRLVQQLASRDVRLWLVTRGACVVDGTESFETLTAATAWGFGRVVRNEHPQLRCTLIDLSSTERAGELEALVRELGDGREHEVAIRGGVRYVARLQREQLETSPVQLRDDAAYLVTGGLGGLGLAAARRLVERGARNLVLLGRRVAVDDAAIAQLRLTARITVERADVTDREAMTAVLRRHAIRGVIHAAGVMTPAMIAAIDPCSLRAALAAKVDGARHLHELTESLDFFVMYSSIATLFGMPGQGAYAAANAYLDALAAYRRARGLAATSIAFTVIEGAGMAARAGAKALGQLRDRGIEPMSIDRANDLVECALAGAPAHFGALSLDLGKWAAFYPQALEDPRLGGLAGTKPPAAPTSRAMSVEAALCAAVASVLHDGVPDPDVPLAELGVDSLAALELHTLIEEKFGVSITTERILAAASIRVLARELGQPGEPPRRHGAVPAAPSLEAVLCDAVASVLGGAVPDPQTPLTELGVDSLAALELHTLIADKLGVSIATERFLGTATIRELAREIAAPAPRAPSSPRDDAHLDPALRFTARERTAPRELLLTGATGFLGAFILAELLEHTQARIHCLVRAATPTEGMQRLEDALGRYGVPALSLRSRVSCLPGDLSKPGLGLDRPPAFDTIVHNGASVNFVYPYEMLKPHNVHGTREILQLAAATGARLHYVSTIGVFPAGAQPAVMEAARSPGPERLGLGYMRAKWVAEELVMQARERGLDVSIYRPGTITGHSRTGVFNPEDFVCALIKGCIQLGVAPSVDVPINLAPVDYVGRALVKIAVDAAPGVYHLVGTNLVAWNQIAAWLRQLGYQLDELPYPAWRALLIERAVATRNALAPLLPLFLEHEDTDWLHLPTYDDANARRATGFECPPIDAALMRCYIERFITSGYLPRP